MDLCSFRAAAVTTGVGDKSELDEVGGIIIPNFK